MTEKTTFNPSTDTISQKELDELLGGRPLLRAWSLNFPKARKKKKAQKEVASIISRLEIFMSGLDNVGEKFGVRGAGIWLDGEVYGLKGVHDGTHIGTAPLESIEKACLTLDRSAPFADYYIVRTASDCEYVLLGWEAIGETRKLLASAHDKAWHSRGA